MDDGEFVLCSAFTLRCLFYRFKPPSSKSILLRLPNPVFPPNSCADDSDTELSLCLQFLSF